MLPETPEQVRDLAFFFSAEYNFNEVVIKLIIIIIKLN